MIATIAPGTPVGAARRRLADAFRAAGLDSPDLDARILVSHALGLDHAGLAAAAEQPLLPAQAEVITALAERRLRHEPVARLVGHKEFWGLTLALGPATLVPRPDTETVVEAALRNRAGDVLRILDLGTGSGALLLALLAELPESFGVGTDISLDALAVARRNAAAFAGRAAFVCCDLATALRGPFDLIVSNPPYIRSGDIAALAPEVRKYDPRIALDGGEDGLDAYRAIAAQAPSLLTPRGRVVVELGVGQAPAVEGLFAVHGLACLALQPDLAGMPRALVTARQE